jgi:hypothetical protein
MSFDWLSLVPVGSGFLGAIVGAGGAITGQKLGVNQQKRQAEAARSQHNIDVQREAVVMYLSTADLLIAEADELRRVLQVAQLRDLVGVVYPRYYERWSEFVASGAAVVLAGPDTIREPAERLQEGIRAQTDAVDRWYRNRRAPSGDEAYDPGLERAQKARAAFAATAADIFDGLAATKPIAARPGRG